MTKFEHFEDTACQMDFCYVSITFCRPTLHKTALCTLTPPCHRLSPGKLSGADGVSHLGGQASAAPACCPLAVTARLLSVGHFPLAEQPAPLSRPGMRLGMSRNSAAATSPKIRIHRRRRRPGRPIRALGWSGGRPMGGRGWSRVRAVCHPDSGRPAPVLSLVPPPTSCSCLASGQLAVMCLATTTTTTTTPPSKPTVLLILFALHS